MVSDAQSLSRRACLMYGKRAKDIRELIMQIRRLEKECKRRVSELARLASANDDSFCVETLIRTGVFTPPKQK